METWDQIKTRQKKEQVELVKEIAQTEITQTEAARELGISPQNLNIFILKNDIDWPVKKQGRKTKCMDQK
jgi:DNA invertase Pin-like site-specific DNA recombinase|tara:strand:+ start:47 stop:256 length:210 start_codon:yes stop_codon:yes gene_type:complete